MICAPSTFHPPHLHSKVPWQGPCPCPPELPSPQSWKHHQCHHLLPQNNHVALRTTFMRRLLGCSATAGTDCKVTHAQTCHPRGAAQAYSFPLALQQSHCTVSMSQFIIIVSVIQMRAALLLTWAVDCRSTPLKSGTEVSESTREVFLQSCPSEHSFSCHR